MAVDLVAECNTKAAAERRQKLRLALNLGALLLYLFFAWLSVQALAWNMRDAYEQMHESTWLAVMGAGAALLAYLLFARPGKVKRIVAIPCIAFSFGLTFFPQSTFIPIATALVGNYNADYMEMGNFLPDFNVRMFSSSSFWMFTYASAVLLVASVLAVLRRAEPAAPPPSP